MRFSDYKTFQTALGGRLLQVDIGRVAEQANGAATVRYGDTVVNVTACMAEKPRENQSFFPLSCEYEERMYAAGKIPGGFIKREGRPSEKATLGARLMDRPIRPLFPKNFFHDVQVVATVLSVDPDCAPEVAAMIGSSIALTISDIPFAGPTATVIMGLIEGKPIINPTLAQREESELLLTISGTKNAIMMIEAGAKEVDEEAVLDAMFAGHEEIKELVEFIENIAGEVGKPKFEPVIEPVPEDIATDVRGFAAANIEDTLRTVHDKVEQSAQISKINKECQETLAEKYPESETFIARELEEILDAVFRTLILKDGLRPDGRKSTEVRPIWCETGFLPRAHGSGLFKRGQTQVLSVTTLGTLKEGQIIDGIGDETGKRYMHHYNFPPYSVGEVRPMRGASRREIGHGALAERALLPVLPTEEEFPYAMRVVSDVLSSNGSSSQGSVCGSTLSLMDAGVPITAPVSGIAMGLVEDESTGAVVILSDIQGLEDHYGDMDFKVAGTPKGITALQMDIKVHGLSREIMRQAIMQAKDGRGYILGQMLQEISEPRTDLSPYAPRIESIQIDPSDIGTIVGKGGKTINGIIAETGVKIDIDDDGLISIASTEPDGMKKAVEMIELLLKEPEVGEIYDGKVTGIKEFGAFVEILPGKEGLLHISEIDKQRVARVEDVLNVGDPVQVKIKGIDDKTGKISLTRKALL
ncbi:MAG: polyribonucleotide nucleotidyltransferase [Clostridiales Family XIII bacterium]|jgi:polyribonucleotide nucleotidyltransferase|nr:polyribonucleotide nucleotidyltransferase [Clostridiales Family XIII bacterium]